MTTPSALAGHLLRLLNLLRREGVRTAARRAGRALRMRLSGTAPAYDLTQWLEHYEARARFAPPQTSEVNAPEVAEFTIIVVTWNNLLLNRICLNSIHANTPGSSFEVVVVDNGSRDGTPAWLREYSATHPNAQILLNDENLGFAAANNQGAGRARGKYLVFLNNDTVVTRGWLDGLAAHLQDKTVGLVGPVTNATGNEACIPTNYVSPEGLEGFAEKHTAAMKGASFDIRMLAFFCVMARKADFDSLGGLDERFGLGMFEDEDLALRYQDAGMRVVCAEDVFVHHFWRQSFGKLDRARYDSLFRENRRKFEDKWGRAWIPYQARGKPPGTASRLAEPPASESRREFATAAATDRVVPFRCNVCGQNASAWLSELGREQRSCACGSTVRLRTVIHLLSTALFGKSIALPDFPTRPDIRGLGMSDAIYPPALSRKLDYVNTFYDRHPRLDITAPLKTDMEGAFDFVISTEVMEHVAPPVARGFQNLRRLLKPSGILILTVPYTLAEDTVEHFPELHKYRIIHERGSAAMLKNITVDGREQVFRELVFHKGEGATLEMRLFSEIGLRNELQRAGFEHVEIFSEPFWEFGIHWPEAWSRPFTARPLRPDLSSRRDAAAGGREGS